jgi:hypothetical protein
MFIGFIRATTPIGSTLPEAAIPTSGK